jgi:hypothetical protein
VEPVLIHQTKLVAAQTLSIAAQKMSAALDSFSSWLVAGFGATLALLIANLDTVSSFIIGGTIKCSAVLFLVSACFACVAKLQIPMLLEHPFQGYVGSCPKFNGHRADFS